MTKRSGKRSTVDAHGLKNRHLLWMFRRVVLVGAVLFTMLVTACARQPWPVPVPESVDVAGQPKRLELRLPVVSPPTCREITLQAFLHQPSRCPQFEQLKEFLEMHAARFTPVDRPAFVVDEDLWALMYALNSEQALSGAPFPKNVPTLPEPIRELRTWKAIDSRDRTPPQGRPTVALLYRCFWWTFWQKTPPPPPPPDAERDPKLRPPFDRLIVFPEFPERIAKGTDAC
jgi:hypothetical protein